MKPALLKWLRCPCCHGSFLPEGLPGEDGQMEEGALRCQCAQRIPIRSGIPRFKEKDDYADSFSFEWKIHAKTQLDSGNGSDRSEKQFQSRLDIPLAQLQGKLVLDAGCGMGRFAEVAARHGATVIGVDLSFAVEVARQNLKDQSGIHWVQADLMDLPFAPETFDLIYSFGVLHHTPNAKGAFSKIAPLLKPGGRMAVFVYSAYNKGIVASSALWRAWTTRLPKRLLYGLCAVSIPLYYLYRLPGIGSLGKLFFVISMEPNWRWRWLDTFDWYSAKYQSKHSHWEVASWFKEAGLEHLSVREGEITLVGTKPIAPAGLPVR